MTIGAGGIALISGGPAGNLGKIVFVVGCPDDPRLPRVGGGGTVWDVQMIATPPLGLDGEEYLRIGIGEDWLTPIPVPKDLAAKMRECGLANVLHRAMEELLQEGFGDEGFAESAGTESRKLTDGGEMTESNDGKRQHDLALDYGDTAADDVARRARQLLIENKFIMFGDSGLRNVWEEIVVQVRGDETAFWDAYEAAMRDAVLSALFSLCAADRLALWLKTDPGRDWRYDQDEDSETISEPPVDDEDIAAFITKERLLSMAVNYTNSRVEKFLCPGCDDLNDIGDNFSGETLGQSGEDAVPSKEHEIEYYDDTWDSGGYLACFDGRYICVIRPDDPQPKWEFLLTDSAHWDAVHQRVYRNFRADRIEKEKLPLSLPPPPTEVPLEVMNPPPPPPPKPIRTEDFPVVTEYLRAGPGRGTAAIHLILKEDTYESFHGDGEFHYPEILFFDLQDAMNYEGDKSGGYRYHIRPGVIWLDGDEIGFEVPGRTFDHFSGVEVLRLVSSAIEREKVE